MLLKTQMTPSAEAKSLERVFNRLLPFVPFAVQSHWEKNARQCSLLCHHGMAGVTHETSRRQVDLCNAKRGQN